MHLYLALSLYFGPIVCRGSGAVAEAVQACRGTPSGCSQSVDMSRLAPWHTFAELHAQRRPV
eukprot:6288948-Pyramimonas_sp.AAC.1